MSMNEIRIERNIFTCYSHFMNKTTLTFTGDIGFDKYMDGKWADNNLISPEVLEYLKDTDHLIVNVEGPLSMQKKVTKPNGVSSLTHSMNPEVAGFLDKIGADIWNINNNHIMDAGTEGLTDTLKLANEHDACTIGAGLDIDAASKPLILPEAGGIGLLSVGYARACRKATKSSCGCLNFSDMDIIRARIEDIKKSCRWCIVVAHDGEEFTALPSPYTRDRFMQYLDWGADIIIAHHPHVPMNYETIGRKVIFYSLGNFIFDTDYQRSQFNTEKGLLIKLRLTEDSFSFEPFGIYINRSKECIEAGPIPAVFENVGSDDYELLKPLAAKLLIENTKRQLRYLKPTEFEKATDEDWLSNFYEPMRSGRVPEKLLDFQIVYPLSLKVNENTWQKSALESIKQYILEQL